MGDLRELENLRRTIEFVARMCWRTDPLNANQPFTAEQRFGAIKFHPTIKRYGEPHIELAERERRALSAQVAGQGEESGR